MNKPLSNIDIANKINCNIIKYSNLINIPNIEILFKDFSLYLKRKKKPCIILYDFPDTKIGHWVLLMDVGRKIEFFDPYGKPPDYYYKIKSIDRDYLSNLLKKSKKGVYYNDFQFQKFAKNIATCGKWCVLRVITYKTYKMSLMEFITFFSLSKNKDRALQFLYSDFLGD